MRSKRGVEGLATQMRREQKKTRRLLPAKRGDLQISSHHQVRLVRIDCPALVKQVKRGFGAVQENQSNAKYMEVNDIAYTEVVRIDGR